MDAVLRALAIYVVILLLFRLTGKRSLLQATTFDFVLLLIVGEATQQALLGDDFSLTNAVTVIGTLIGLDRLADYLGFRFPRLDKLMESTSVILIDDGKPLKDRMDKAHVNEEDILEQARQNHGIERMDQVKFAVLERSGSISVIPTGQ
ncbi:MAG TPA: YetF domain-containing protein [Nocardioidaceae bacterium]|nr:YetF domain-containing protein [Nocardioidaceae bacterium]